MGKEQQGRLRARAPAPPRACHGRLRRPTRQVGRRCRRRRPARSLGGPGGAASVAVVGADVSGLVATYRLSKSGVRVTVFEADDRAGGKIRTNSDNGYLGDEGANTMTESALEASRLIDYLGLEDRLQYPNSQHKRYTVKDGAPARIPSDPIALMKSSLLSTKSKFKLFLEPFLYEKSSTKNSKKVSDEHISERKCRRDAACLLLKTEGRTTNLLYMSSANYGAANLVAQLVAIISCSLFAAKNEKKSSITV